MPSGQEMEWAYSIPPDPHSGQTTKTVSNCVTGYLLPGNTVCKIVFVAVGILVG